MSPEPALTGPGPKPIVLPEPPPAADAPAAPDDTRSECTPTLALPAPQDRDDRPWEHPADGGEPLDGHALWTNTTAFGRFQKDGEFPDDVAQALRAVLERMHRAGFRDWEAEWDYVECAYRFLRRDLEVNAREAFRVWYGGDRWQTPYRMASHLQETGQIEYRIDHLLTSEFGVEIRKQEVPEDEAPETAKQPLRARPYRGELKHLMEQCREVMTPGEFLTAGEIAVRLQPLAGFDLTEHKVYMYCHLHPEQFEQHGSRGNRVKVRFSLRPR